MLKFQQNIFLHEEVQFIEPDVRISYDLFDEYILYFENN